MINLSTLIYVNLVYLIILNIRCGTGGKFVAVVIKAIVHSPFLFLQLSSNFKELQI